MSDSPTSADGGVMPTMPDEVREKARQAGAKRVPTLTLYDTQRQEDAADAAAEVAYAAGRADGLAEGEQRERMRVAAWLRARTIRNDLGIEYPDYAARDLAALLDGMTERGEHLDD